jgi:hypothetical protein
MTEKPEMLVVGTEASGLMEVIPEMKAALIAETTGKACNKYNQLCHSQKNAAALHTYLLKFHKIWMPSSYRLILLTDNTINVNLGLEVFYGRGAAKGKSTRSPDTV